MQDPDITNARAYLTLMKKAERKKVSKVLNANQKIKYSKNEGVFYVRSEKFINKVYRVYPHIDQKWGCTCEGFYKWGSSCCKHIKAAKTFLLLNPTLKLSI